MFILKLNNFFMKLNKLKPTSNGSRHTILLKKNLLSKNSKVVKQLLKGIKNTSGRSTLTGRITVRHKGGRCKKLYRILDTTPCNTFSIVVSVLHDPNRNTFISLNFDLLNRNFFNTSNTNFIYPGSIIVSSSKILDLKLGYRTALTDIPTGSLINNLSINNLKNSTYIRSAGTFGQIIQKGLDVCKIKLPSNKILEVPTSALATIGSVSNKQHNLIVKGKAGRSRYLGVRPGVRGIAMNPVDHPHGGRTNGGRPSVTPWGKPTRGKPTRKKIK